MMRETGGVERDVLKCVVEKVEKESPFMNHNDGVLLYLFDDRNVFMMMNAL